MSHFTVLVIGENYEEQLAPYDESITVAPYRDYLEGDTLAWYRETYAKDHEGREATSDQDVADHLNEKWSGEGDGELLRVDEKGLYRLSTYNPNSKWDWYQIGGRWRGYFKLKQGTTVGASQVGNGGAFDNEPLHDADVIRKGDVDIEYMRDSAIMEAAERWDTAQDVFGDLPEAKSWSSYIDRVKQAERDGDQVFTIEVAREQYHDQPRVKALRTASETIRWAHVEDLQVSREVYIERARRHALSTYAYVKDGEWFAPGRMGWFGMSSETENEEEQYVREFNEMLDALPDDTLLTLVDCHI